MRTPRRNLPPSSRSALAPLPLHIVAPSRWLADVVRASRVGRRWRVHHIPNAVEAEFGRPAELLRQRHGPRGERPTVLIVEPQLSR